MKNVIAIALTLATVAGAATAATTPRLDSEALRFIPAAAATQLSDTQIHQINSIVHSTDDSNQTASQIRSVLK